MATSWEASPISIPLTFRPDGSVLRIQRVSELVAVEPDEADNERARATANFRRADPDWKWNGPAIPATKPPFTGIQIGKDGRIWVQLFQPGVRVPDEELHRSDDPAAASDGGGAVPDQRRRDGA